MQHVTKEFVTATSSWSKKNAPVVHAITDVDLKVEKGETLGIVGESGCGKSTLGRLMINLLVPTSGHVIFEGKDLQSLSIDEMRKTRQRMQMVFQDPFASLNPRMKIRDLIAEPMVTHNYGTSDEITARVEELLRLTGIRPEFMLSDVFFECSTPIIKAVF
jgi:ATPase components of various ABC-type transport systems, contain duplicated ATPase